MQTTIRAFAIGLAFAVLSSAVYADSHITDYGEHCTSSLSDDAFDGAIATMACFSDETGISIGAVCRNGETNAQILIGRYVLERGLTLRTALDGVETPQWEWSISTSNKALFIKPPIPTLKEVSKHASLRIRIVEMDGDTHNAEIDVSALGEAIQPIRELCGW